MIELLTGLGLAMSAGLNAYVPLLLLGLLTRYTSFVELPQQWAWLGNGWVLGALAVLLVVEVVTDKVPAVDHLNDLLHTLIRPVAGGVVFASGASSVTEANADVGAGDGTLGPFLAGLVVALVVHMTKAAGRSVVNLSTAGIGAPVISTVEDVSSVLIALIALVVPVLVLVVVAAGIAMAVWVLRRRQQTRRRHQAAPS